MTWRPGIDPPAGKRFKADTPTRLARATRFFARLESFTLECPRCGRVHLVRIGKHGQYGKGWDPTTGRFTCQARDCRRVYVLGIVAWPIGPSPQTASQPPADQVPSPRQVAELRKEGGGWWLSDEAKITYARPLETNLTTEEERPAHASEDPALDIEE